MQLSQTISQTLKKRMIIGGIIAAVIIIAVFAVLSFQGVFTNPGTRNSELEEQYEEKINGKLENTFDHDSGFNLVSGETAYAIYEKDGEIASKKCVITLTFEGESLDFTEYKEFVYDVQQRIVDKMNWKPSEMQVFYRRYPKDGEAESVLQFESRVQKYLFGTSRENITGASATHYEVELDEERAARVKWYYFAKNTIINVLTATVIALVIFCIVKRIIKYRKSRKKHIDSDK